MSIHLKSTKSITQESASDNQNDRKNFDITTNGEDTDIVTYL